MNETSLPAIAGLAGLAVDDRMPREVVRPVDETAVRDLVERARRDALALIPSGGRTAIAIGNQPSRHDVAVDLGQLSAIGDHSAADLVVTAGAGTRLSDLNEFLLASNQQLPLEAPPGATLGGIVAAAQAGKRRLWRGTPRDWLIGARAVLGDGRVVRAGAKVVKNVAGYDLLKLLCGSCGTLAILTEVTFKVAPVSEAIAAWRVPCGSLAQAEGVRQSASTLQPAWIELSSAEDAPFAVEVGFEGDAAAVAWQSERFTARVPAAGPCPEAPLAAAYPSPLELVFGTLPDRLAAVLDACRRAGDPRIQAHLGSGMARLSCDRVADDVLAAWQEEIARSGGWWRLERGPKQGRECFGPVRASWAIAAEIKRLFDPEGILSPGRAAGRV